MWFKSSSVGRGCGIGVTGGLYGAGNSGCVAVALVIHTGNRKSWFAVVVESWYYHHGTGII